MRSLFQPASRTQRNNTCRRNHKGLLAKALRTTLQVTLTSLAPDGNGLQPNRLNENDPIIETSTKIQQKSKISLSWSFWKQRVSELFCEGWFMTEILWEKLETGYTSAFSRSRAALVTLLEFLTSFYITENRKRVFFMTQLPTCRQLVPSDSGAV